MASRNSNVRAVVTVAGKLRVTAHAEVSSPESKTVGPFANALGAPVPDHPCCV